MSGLQRMAPDPPKSSTEQNLQLILASVGPILTQLPKWIELGAYLEFGDDEVRLCELCHNVCEWVYFKLLQFNSDGLELCGSCLEKYKKTTPWTLYVREGLIVFLGSLNAVATGTSPAGLEIKPSHEEEIVHTTLLPSLSKPDSPAQSFEQCSPSGQLLEARNFEPVSHTMPLLLPLSSESLHAVPSSKPALLKANSEPLLYSSSSDPVLFTTSSDPTQFASGAEPGYTLNTEPTYFLSNSDPLHFRSDSERILFPPNDEGEQFRSLSDPTLLTSNSEPVLFTSNAEPVHFISHSKPVLFSSNSEPPLFSSYAEPEGFSDSLGLIPKSEPLRFISTSVSLPFKSNLESLPTALGILNHEALSYPTNSGPLPATPSSELSQSSADISLPTSETTVRTQSKSGKKVSDGTLVDRMRTIVQQDCRLGKELFTTGIELVERYNSCYKHETIHVRRVFEAMKTLGYAASKDTMQVHVQKVRRKVKLIYGLAMK